MRQRLESRFFAAVRRSRDVRRRRGKGLAEDRGDDVMRMLIIFTALCAFFASCDSPDPDRIAGKLAENLAMGKWEDARSAFTPQMEKALSAGQLEQQWSGLVSSAGAFAGFGQIRPESVPEYEVRYVPCVFGQTTLELKVVVDRGGRVAGFFVQPAAPPAVKPPAGVIETALDLENGTFILPGTLCKPDGAGPFPAVVFVHGSGPNDRDESLGPNAPFRDLARDLALRGIASWRFDKRTKVYGQKAFQGGETVDEEAVDDAIEAVVKLSSMDGIEPGRIFLVGHSLGGTLMPRLAKVAAARGLRVAGFVSMAGAVTPIPDLMMTQLEYLASLDGSVSGEERAAIDATSVQARQATDKALLAADPARRVLGVAASYWLDLATYDPAAEAASLAEGGARFLFMQGGRDYQVPPAELQKWRDAIGDRADYAVYPDLNHLFIAGTGQPTNVEYFVPGHVDAKVVDDLAAWINSGS